MPKTVLPTLGLAFVHMAVMRSALSTDIYCNFIILAKISYLNPKLSLPCR